MSPTQRPAWSIRAVLIISFSGAMTTASPFLQPRITNPVTNTPNNTVSPTNLTFWGDELPLSDFPTSIQTGDAHIRQTLQQPQSLDLLPISIDIMGTSLQEVDDEPSISTIDMIYRLNPNNPSPPSNPEQQLHNTIHFGVSQGWERKNIDDPAHFKRTEPFTLEISSQLSLKNAWMLVAREGFVDSWHAVFVEVPRGKTKPWYSFHKYEMRGLAVCDVDIESQDVWCEHRYPFGESTGVRGGGNGTAGEMGATA